MKTEYATKAGATAEVWTDEKDIVRAAYLGSVRLMLHGKTFREVDHFMRSCGFDPKADQ